jgi:hypothetical protein
MESAKAVLESASSGYGAAISAPGRTGAHHVRFGSKADQASSPRCPRTLLSSGCSSTSPSSPASHRIASRRASLRGLRSESVQSSASPGDTKLGPGDTAEHPLLNVGVVGIPRRLSTSASDTGVVYSNFLPENRKIGSGAYSRGTANRKWVSQNFFFSPTFRQLIRKIARSAKKITKNSAGCVLNLLLPRSLGLPGSMPAFQS